MHCISSISYSVIINRKVERGFKPSRGIPQCDPLSPFLFLICNEGLSVLMNRALQKGKIKVSSTGLRLHTYYLRITVCCLGKRMKRGIHILKMILKKYANCFIQCINFDKSSVFFSANVLEEKRLMMSGILSIRYSNNQEHYLGLQNLVGKSKKLVFQGLKDRISQKFDT